MNTTPEITINITVTQLPVLDEQSARQDEMREAYLRWLSENEVRNSDNKSLLKLSPTRENLNPGW